MAPGCSCHRIFCTFNNHDGKLEFTGSTPGFQWVLGINYRFDWILNHQLYDVHRGLTIKHRVLMDSTEELHGLNGFNSSIVLV